ncbi:hypothetical protein VN97_g3166 [Penicillium thymicola]|uniref:Uncharacterized protein n=1 Tax=Penicillium thymicola TaxID=293382 RepID=A0AAI9XBJ8_PENTH|nr:hypothetical protein VN97_g3166 [Penicillium thymicola]
MKLFISIQMAMFWDSSQVKDEALANRLKKWRYVHLYGDEKLHFGYLFLSLSVVNFFNNPSTSHFTMHFDIHHVDLS